MKKPIIHNFSFYVHKKIYRKTHEIKKILNIKLIFHYQDTIELPFLSLRMKEN